MMLYLYVQQNQWIVITLLAGVALTLLLCLTYQALWRPRDVPGDAGESRKTAGSSFAAIMRIVPWVIIVLVLVCVSFTIATVLFKSCSPPNW